MCMHGPGSQPDAIIVCECKDWAKPVGTDAVHILASKMETIKATQGFLIARRLTKDARALLGIKPKLQFVRCSSEFAGLLNSARLCHSVRSPLARRVTFRFRGISPSSTLDWVGKTCQVKNQAVDFRREFAPGEFIFDGME